VDAVKSYRRLSLFLAIAIALSSLCVTTYPQSHATITTVKTASSENVRAELSYQEPIFPNPLAEIYLSELHLKLIRKGQVALDEMLPVEAGAKVYSLGGPEVRDLDGDGEPEVLLNIRAKIEQFSFTLIYRFDPSSSRYTREQRPLDEKLQASNQATVTRTATSSNIRAELSYNEDILIEDIPHLRLVRQGQILLNQSVKLTGRDPGVIGSVDGPAVRDLDGDGEPEVILNVLERGAHCCAYSFIYHYLPTQKRYARLDHFWTNYRNTPELKDLDQDGKLEFVSGNEKFSGEFGPYAITGARPIQIWRYRQGRMQDVTRRYPKLIRKDAQIWWHAYHETRSDWFESPVALAAYLADKCLLGESVAGWKDVRQDYRDEDRQAYFRRLSRALRAHGYR